VNDILNEDLLKNMHARLQVNTTSSFLLWNETGKFRWEKLPVSLQVSPVKRMVVQDFNHDDLPDVLVAGNDYTYDVATGYFDANKGMVLLNKGNGSFDVLKPPESGILLQGMVESLLYFSGEPSLVVAGLNRAGVKVFKQVR
jgi:hypothetical protein